MNNEKKAACVFKIIWTQIYNFHSLHGPKHMHGPIKTQNIDFTAILLPIIVHADYK